MAIVYIENKRTLKIWHSMLLALTTVLLAVLFMRSEASSKTSGVILEVKAPSLMAYPNVSDNVVATPVQAKVPLMPIELKGKDWTNPKEASYAPAYGMDAVGQEGAWDGRDQDGNLAVDATVACIDVSTYTTPQLKQFVPQGVSADPCGYGWRYRVRNDRPPAEIIAGEETIVAEYIRVYVKTGLWTISDFEKIKIKNLAPTAALSVYLVLKNANSPYASQFLNLKGDDGSQIEEYQKSGKCPTGRYDSLSGPYCLLPFLPEAGY